jgi:hypothetical protein
MQAIGPYGPVLPTPKLLDATLDEMMWGQYGISLRTHGVDADHIRKSSAGGSGGVQQVLHTPQAVAAGGGDNGSESGHGHSSRLCTLQPSSPAVAGSSASGEVAAGGGVWGSLGAVVRVAAAGGAAAGARGRSSGQPAIHGASAGPTAAAAGGGGGACTAVSHLNDIIQVGPVRPPVTPPGKIRAAVGAVGGGGGGAAAAVGAAAAAAADDDDDVQFWSSSPLQVRTTAAPQPQQQIDPSSVGTTAAATTTAVSRVSLAPPGLLLDPLFSEPSSCSGTIISAGLVLPSPPGSPMAAVRSGGEREWVAVGGHALELLAVSTPSAGAPAATTGAVDAAAAAADVARGDAAADAQCLLAPPWLERYTAAVAGQRGQAPRNERAEAQAVADCHAAARAARQQRQRVEQVRGMCAPVDAAMAAAALGITPPPAVAVAADGRNNSSAGAAAAALPDLATWSAHAADLGMTVEVQAAWWSPCTMQEAWALGEDGSREAHIRYIASLPRLLEPGCCAALRSWYEQAMFAPPVLLGSTARVW